MMLVLLVFVALMGATAAQNNGLLYREEKNMSFDMEQKVSGDGFFSVYRYALMPDVLGTEGRLYNGVEAKIKQHGSGSIDVEAGFSGESTYTNTSDWNAESEDLERYKGAHEIEELDEYDEDSSAFINVKEDGAMTYSPTAMAVGSKYYAIHPLAFNSLLGEETVIKNRDGNNSMSQRVEGAHAVNKQLEAQSDLTDTSLNVEEDVTEGKVSLKAVQLPRNPVDESEDELEGNEIPGLIATRESKQPLIVFEQDYTGTYHIKHNMTMSVPWDETDYADAWLPCCFAGYLTMPPYYQRGSYGFGSNVRGLFDCTCFKVPQAAEFPVVYPAAAT